MADKINVNRSNITLFIKGSIMPSIEKMIEVSKVFNTSVDVLLGRPRLSSSPDGKIEYCLKTSILLTGELKYSFGITDDAEKKAFIYIEDKKLIDYILESTSQSDFLSLVYILNLELGLEYNAFTNNNVDILVEVEDRIQEMYIDLGYSARLSLINYDTYVYDWLKLSSEEKIKKMEEIYSK